MTTTGGQNQEKGGDKHELIQNDGSKFGAVVVSFFGKLRVHLRPQKRRFLQNFTIMG